MSKAVITGGAGALGSTLANMLVAKNYEVHIYDVVQRDRAWRLAEIINEVQYHWKSCEDMTEKDFKDIQLVLHCCAQPDRPLGISSPRATLQTNIMALANVLEQLKDQQIDKFIYPGSGTSFTGCTDKCTEETVPKPTNPYSASKYMAEILCQTYYRCYDLPVVLLRSGLVYGAGMRLDISIAQFIMNCLLNKHIHVRSPTATRTPTHIDDVMEYWKAVIEAPSEKVVGQLFHSVYGKEYTIMEIAQTVRDVVGHMGVEVIAAEFEKGEILAGKPVRECTTSIKNELLGVKPDVDLAEGIRRTIPYIKDQLGIEGCWSA